MHFFLGGLVQYAGFLFFSFLYMFALLESWGYAAMELKRNSSNMRDRGAARVVNEGAKLAG